jgi:hypothetical protein
MHEDDSPPPPPPAPPAPPSIHPDEQRKYWAQDLRFRRIQLYISVIGFALVLGGLVLSYRQTGNAASLTRAQVNNIAITHMASINRLFVEKPYLSPYFYCGKPIEKTDERYLEARAVAGLMLDAFDFFADQSKYFPQYWDKPASFDDWMSEVFANSPILRETFDELQHFYSDGLKEKRLRGPSKPPKTSGG